MPDWFPLQFGHPYEWAATCRGKRIYPPRVWDQRDVCFWGKGRKDYEQIWGPWPEFDIVLPAQHPVRQFVKRGRPPKKMPNGTTLL